MCILKWPLWCPSAGLITYRHVCSVHVVSLVMNLLTLLIILPVNAYIDSCDLKCFIFLFMYTSTTEYNEKLHDIQRTLWDIKNEATQLAKRLVDDLPNRGRVLSSH